MLFVTPPSTQVPEADEADVAQFRAEGRASWWTPEKLLDRVRWMAEEVGPYDGLLPLIERRYRLLERTADYELWVIYWPEGPGLSLHDHGGSAGAFHVIGGALEETGTTRRGLRLRRRRLEGGQGRSFGPEHVHGIINPHAAPATSVHAYSPPLTSMTFYSKLPTGLVATRVVTDWEGAPPD